MTRDDIQKLGDGPAIMRYMNEGHPDGDPARVGVKDMAGLTKEDRAELGPLAREALCKLYNV